MDTGKHKHEEEISTLSSILLSKNECSYSVAPPPDITEGKMAKSPRQEAKQQVEIQMAYSILELQATAKQRREQHKCLTGSQPQENQQERIEILELSHDAILIRDLENTITFWNQNAEKIYGFSPQEALGKSSYELLRSEFYKSLSQVEAELLEKGRWEGEIIHTKHDGTQILVNSRWVLKYDIAGKPKEIWEINQDITPAKEEAWRAKEELYRQMFEANQAIMLLIEPQSGAIVDANPAADNFYGYQPNLLKQLKITDLDTLSPERVFSYIAQATSENNRCFYLRHKLASGEIRDVEVHFNSIFWQKQKLLYSVIHDITERKKTEAALRDRESILRSFYDSAPMTIGIIEITENDIIEISCNAGANDFFGFTPAAMQNHRASHLGVSSENIKNWINYCRESEKSGSPVRFEYTQNTAAGFRWLSATVCPVSRKNSDVELQKNNLFPPLNLKNSYPTDRHPTPNYHSPICHNVFCYVVEDITERKQAEKFLQQANEKLTEWVKELEARNREIILLGEMNNILQACLTTEEAHGTLAELIQPLFPDMSGAVFVLDNSKQLAEAIARWGDANITTKLVFSAHECWALRRGRSHLIEFSQSGMHCHHVHKEKIESMAEVNNLIPETLCVPMMAQGEAVGTLYLYSPDRGKFTPAKQQLAITVAEQIAMGLANLKLHEALQQQSIRDPLTGLFNRRYLEESLEREICRAERKHQSVGIIMLDIDHFKRFNDTFGHNAGDSVLREVGIFLLNNIRGSDIACRYGGEEFILILPEVSLEATKQRAEKIREGIKHLNLQNRRQHLGTITLSLGVAIFPQHGITGEAVIQAADTALYRAKAEGRDRVSICSD